MTFLAMFFSLSRPKLGASAVLACAARPVAHLTACRFQCLQGMFGDVCAGRLFCKPIQSGGPWRRYGLPTRKNHLCRMIWKRYGLKSPCPVNSQPSSLDVPFARPGKRQFDFIPRLLHELRRLLLFRKSTSLHARKEVALCAKPKLP